MRVQVNGVRLYFDVAGAGLRPGPSGLSTKPTVILLHGGPGADHSVFKPNYDQLAEVAQVIYLDHRGNGRSDDGPTDKWTLAQWGQDVKAFCDALEIERPIVLGVSFGGFVAQSYATQFPDHAGGVILVSTAARFDFEAMFDAFERIGGAEARAAAEGYWRTPTSESRKRYGEVCLPLYFASRQMPDWVGHVRMKDDVALHFNGMKNEQARMDFRDALARVACPMLIVGGEEDPITPIAFTDEIAAHAPAARYERIPGAGHGVAEDRGDAFFPLVRDFIKRIG